jgi:hypothetical protein
MCQGGMQYTNWYHNICTSSVCSLLEDIWREYLDFDAVIEQRKLHNESYNHHFNILKFKFQESKINETDNTVENLQVASTRRKC